MTQTNDGGATGLTTDALCASGPVRALTRAAGDESKAGWIISFDDLQAIRAAAGDWGYGIDLEAVEAIALDVERRILAALTPARQATCRKCGGTMRPCHALAQTYTSGEPDDLGGDAQTMSAGGPGVLIDCRKCEDCGWSVTADPQPEVATQTAQEAVQVTLTYSQKLEALSLRFYQGMTWNPKAGDYYTTSRADLELYRVVKVEDGMVKTQYCDQRNTDAVASWPVEEFTSAGFGPKRVWVPDFVLSAHPPQPSASVVEAMKHLQDIINCGNCSGSRQSARLALRALKGSDNG